MQIDAPGAPPVRESNCCQQVSLVAVDPAPGHQAHDVNGTALRDGLIDSVSVGRVIIELACLDGVVDTRHVLKDNAAGPETHVADLGVAHLPVRQPHIPAGARYERMWRLRPEPVPHGRLAIGYRIISRLFSISPAVEDDQQ